MAGPFDFLRYGALDAEGGDSGLGPFPLLTSAGMPSLEASLHLPAALGGLPVSSAPQGYGDAMMLAQQLLQLAPSAPDSWAGARPISPSDLGLLPMQSPASAAVPSAPLSQGYADAMGLARQLLQPVPGAPDPWAGVRPISPADLLPMQRPAAAVPIAPAATAENFGWLGLPGTPKLSPYDASAAPPATAENFGWQGLPNIEQYYRDLPPPSLWQRFFDKFLWPTFRKLEPPLCPPEGCVPSGGIRGEIGGGGILPGRGSVIPGDEEKN
jgi:hypothetical protein